MESLKLRIKIALLNLVKISLLSLIWFLNLAPLAISLLGTTLMYLIFFGPHPQQFIPDNYAIGIFIAYCCLVLWFLYKLYYKEKILNH